MAEHLQNGVTVRNRKFIFFMIILFTLTAIHPDNSDIIFINGSNIYSRIFLFFFPISPSYEAFFRSEENGITAEIMINRKNIKNEPATPPFFTTDLTFILREIPYNATGEFILPVTIRCNKKITIKKAKFSIVALENIRVIKGVLTDATVSDLTTDPYFKNRFGWSYPFYFDLRFQLPD